jgi:hypothetical protein
MKDEIQEILLESHDSWHFDPDTCQRCEILVVDRLTALFHQRLSTIESVVKKKSVKGFVGDQIIQTDTVLKLLAELKK